MNLTEEDVRYIVAAIDAYIRTNGLNVATHGIAIVAKMQAATAEDPDPE